MLETILSRIFLSKIQRNVGQQCCCSN